MTVQIEEAPPQGLSTTQITNESAAARVGKPDLRNGFTKLPNSVLVDSSLSMGACRLYALLAHYQGSNTEAWPGQRKLCAELGRSESQVRRYLRALEKAGLVKTRQVGLRKTNRYTVVNPGTVIGDEGCSANPTDMLDRSSMHVPKGRRTSERALPPTPLLKKSRSRHRTAESHFASGEVFVNEQPPNTPTREKNSELVGIEPPRSDVTYSEMSLGLLGFGEVEVSYAYASFHRLNTNSGLVEPSRPAAGATEQKGSVAKPVETEEERYWREHRRREAAGLCNDCGESSELEIYRSCLRCATCRAAHEEIDRKYKLGRFAEQPQAEGDRMPWEVAEEGASTETHSVQSATDEGKTSTPEKPEQKRSPLEIEYEQRIAAWVASGGAAISSEPPELEIPSPPEADRQVEETPCERIERKLDELPVTVAIAIGGHPAEEAEQALADADAERGL